MRVADLLGQDIARNLVATDVKTRKQAGQRLEQRVRTVLLGRGGVEEVNKIIAALKADFLESPNSTKGGLLGLAAISVGLEGEIKKHGLLKKLLLPVIKLFEADTWQVRYFACESAYNICKVAGEAVLELLNEIWEATMKMSADVDVQVRHAQNCLDRVIKDIVSHARPSDLDDAKFESFLKVMSDNMTAKNPFCREMVLSWFAFLLKDFGPQMVQRLHLYMDHLLGMLVDQNGDIRNNADDVLNELRQGLKQKPVGQRGAIMSGTVGYLVDRLSSDAHLRDARDTACTRLTALSWLHEYLRLMIEEGPAQNWENMWVSRLVEDILAATLRCISDQEEIIRTMAVEMNNALLELVPKLRDSLPVQKVLDQLLRSLRDQISSMDVRTASLQWICMLLDRCPEQTFGAVDSLFEPLAKTLEHENDEVVAATLCVLAQIMRGCPSVDFDGKPGRDSFCIVTEKLLELFKVNRHMLQTKGWLMIRHLCGHVDPRRFYVTVARAICGEKHNAEFAQELVKTFNWILLTSSETKDLREELLLTPPLLTITGTPEEETPFFMQLLEPWFFNPVSTLALCLWSQQYEFASELTERFAAFEPTLDLLMQLDQLVHLLESPVFSRMRLRLLEPQRHPALLKCLLGLAMLLPQADAFNILRERLHVVQSGLLLESQLVSLHQASQGPKARDGVLSWAGWRSPGQAVAAGTAGAASASADPAKEVERLLDRFDEVAALSQVDTGLYRPA